MKELCTRASPGLVGIGCAPPGTGDPGSVDAPAGGVNSSRICRREIGFARGEGVEKLTDRTVIATKLAVCRVEAEFLLHRKFHPAVDRSVELSWPGKSCPWRICCRSDIAADESASSSLSVVTIRRAHAACSPKALSLYALLEPCCSSWRVAGCAEREQKSLVRMVVWPTKTKRERGVKISTDGGR